VGIIGGEDLRLAEIARTMASIGSAISMDAQIRMGTVLDKAVGDSLRIVVLLFREWNPLYASEADEHDDDAPASSPPEPGKGGARYASAGRASRGKAERSTYNNRFDSQTATCRNGENLDKPTYLRRKLHIDLA